MEWLRSFAVGNPKSGMDAPATLRGVGRDARYVVRGLTRVTRS